MREQRRIQAKGKHIIINYSLYVIITHCLILAYYTEIRDERTMFNNIF